MADIAAIWEFEEGSNMLFNLLRPSEQKKLLDLGRQDQVSNLAPTKQSRRKAHKDLDMQKRELRTLRTAKVSFLRDMWNIYIYIHIYIHIYRKIDIDISIYIYIYIDV